MPGILPRYNADDKKIDQMGDDERGERAKRIQRAWKYYQGEHDLPLNEGKEIILNLEGQAVDRVTDFVGLPKLSTTAENDDDVEMALTMLKTASEFAELFSDLLTSGQVEGHSYLRIIPPADGAISLQNPPILGMIPAQYVTVYWDMAVWGMKQAALWYRLQWEDGTLKRRQDIVPSSLLDGGEGWQIIEYEWQRRDGVGGQSQWVEIARDVWAYPFAPIVDAKNRRKPFSYYGAGEIDDTRIQDAINFVATNTAKIIKHHAHPTGIAIGSKPPDASEIGGVWYMPEGDFKLVEMSGDLKSSMDFLAILRGAFFSEARVVDPAVIKDRIGQATNFTMRMLYSDMIDHAYDKRDRYGNLIAESFRRMMAMLGYDVEIVANWDELLPMNRVELLQTLQLEETLGIASKTTIATDAGRNFEYEQRQRAEEQFNQVDATAGILTALGERGIMGTPRF